MPCKGKYKGKGGGGVRKLKFGMGGHKMVYKNGRYKSKKRGYGQGGGSLMYANHSLGWAI